MQASAILHRPLSSVTTIGVLIALLLAFALGAVSGYMAKAISAPRAAAAVTAAVCPAGTHVAVWYSTKTWGCISDR